MTYGSNRGGGNVEGPSFLVLLAVAGGLIWLSIHLGPPMVQGQLRPLPALVFFVAGIMLLRLAIRGLELLACLIDWQSSRTPTGKDGLAAWARKNDYKAELREANGGPFWGLSLGRKPAPLFIDYVSNAMTVAPAGSGKGICTVVPNGMSIRASKAFADFKGELVCMLKQPLEARGEIVRILNPGGLWEETIGPSELYSPLDILADDLNRPGGLRDIPDDQREMNNQILPEPSERESENSYFREGSRRLMADAELMEVMVDEYDATFSSAALLIEDRQRLEDMARWMAGVDLDGKPHPGGPFPIEQTPWAAKHDVRDVAEFAQLVRARAHNLLALATADDSRTFDSFITGAQQALAPFAFGRIAPCMGRSTFSMDELKQGDHPTNLFIVADASRMEAYKPFIGLIQWCCMTAIKRHNNKERPVYFILDEATNYRVSGLESLLTWGRSYGLRLHVIFQDFAAFERIYGKTALDTLLSETEIKQILPGQRSPKTLELISKKMLGDQSIMAASIGRDNHLSGLRETMSETGRPLMTMDELRRTDKGLLFVRRCKPILFEPVSYAEISPWRDQVGINPYFGKPYRKKVKLRL